MLVPSKSTQPPFTAHYVRRLWRGSIQIHGRRGLEPGAGIGVMHVVPAGVVKAVSLSSWVVVLPRNAILNSSRISGLPVASTGDRFGDRDAHQAEARRWGRLGRRARLGIVPGRSIMDGVETGRAAIAASPSVECEHAATNGKGPKPAERGRIARYGLASKRGASARSASASRYALIYRQGRRVEPQSS